MTTKITPVFEPKRTNRFVLNFIKNDQSNDEYAVPDSFLVKKCDVTYDVLNKDGDHIFGNMNRSGCMTITFYEPVIPSVSQILDNLPFGAVRIELAELDKVGTKVGLSVFKNLSLKSIRKGYDYARTDAATLDCAVDFSDGILMY